MEISLRRKTEKIELLDENLNVKHTFNSPAKCCAFLGVSRGFLSTSIFRFKGKSKPYPTAKKRGTNECFYIKATFID